MAKKAFHHSCNLLIQPLIVKSFNFLEHFFSFPIWCVRTLSHTLAWMKHDQALQKYTEVTRNTVQMGQMTPRVLPECESH